MSNNLSKLIKELTISYLSDGQMRSTKEIKTFLTKNNVNFEKSHSNEKPFILCLSKSIYWLFFIKSIT